MHIALGVSHVDYTAAVDLIEWLSEINSYSKHRALVVGSLTLDMAWIGELVARLQRAEFGQVEAIRLAKEDTRGWPTASNLMFRAAAEWMEKRGTGPWLWLEPDAIPTQPDWLDQIEAEYNEKKRPFMGTFYTMPVPHMNGVAVYPRQIAKHHLQMRHLSETRKSWDLLRPEMTLRLAFNTPLIQRSLADPNKNEPHTFPDQESLKLIRGKAVLFHGCKDGTLAGRLREQVRATLAKNQPKEVIELPENERISQAEVMVKQPPLACVFPFCQKDLAIAQAWMLWVRELGGCKENPCILLPEYRLDQAAFADIHRLAIHCFSSVEVIRPTGSLPSEKWPYGPNWMFETAVRHAAANLTSPFWWNEPDCIPLKEGWLMALEDEYYRGGKLFMGHLVPGKLNAYPQHLTGCAVYPPSCIHYVKNGFGSRWAWDVASANAVVPETHHTTLFWHEWKNTGGIDSFKKQSDLTHIPRECVVLHSNKDGSLIERLMERRQHPVMSKTLELVGA